ncbi:ferritin-like domain-containing protein [Myxococcota bacterium]|nr:ferritin-like domain-containing protein [Myxococcota bacterium]
MAHINVDPIYEATDRDDFATMIEVGRYTRRSSDFDELIERTHDHFWNPLDADYIDFSTPFDMKAETLIPEDMIAEFNSAIGDQIDESRRVEFTNENARFILSQILHGEQGALSLSSSLCQILVDPGAVEYASNQVREEARHVTAFTEYMKARFEGRPYEVGHMLGTLMKDVYVAPEVYKKLVGMQMLIEGLAMGAFATLHMQARDPLLQRLVRLVMTDEAFHHKFGKIWADKTIDRLPEEERNTVEDWAASCFQALLYNLAGANQKAALYERFGVDPEWAMGAMAEAFTDSDRRKLMQRPANIFRVLIKTLHRSNIITERTRHTYAAWIDMDELKAEDDRMVGDDIAEAGILELRDINESKDLGPARV